MKRKGFTLIELMVAVTVLGIVMAAIMVVVNNANRAKRDNDLVMEAQQQARAGLDMVVRDVRTTGYDIPFTSDQLRVVYARPFECIFNSNISPYPDSQNIRQQPLCYDPSISPTCPNASNIAVFFTTGSETYRYTIDSDNNGDYFTGADRTDDPIETSTRNPNDYVLVRQAYGKMTSGTYSGTNNIYPAINQPVALIRGPSSATDYTIIPLFQYWYRPAGNDTLKLVGDGNNDGVLTGAERNFANPSADILASIEEITTTVTAETRIPIRGVYRQVVVTTRTNLNNVPISSTRYTVSGSYTYPEAGTSPIPNANVYISSGTMQTTTSTGTYSFTVDPGSYTVTPEKLIDGTGYYYLLRHPPDTLADASAASVANLNFKYEAIPDGDMCHITGEVYNDTIAPGPPAMPDAGERRIGGVAVTATGISSIAGTGSTIISLSKITNSSGQYELIVPVGTYTVREYDSAGYFSTTPNDTVITMAATGTTIAKNFGDIKVPCGAIKITVWADTNKNFRQEAGEPLIPNVNCRVTKGGALDIPVANGLTDANGQVLIQVPADTVLSITEVDLNSMYSTCAIKLGYTAGLDSAGYDTLKPRSRIDSIIVLRDSTYRAKFGDVTGFVTLNLGTTERVLCLITPNLGETVDPPGSNNNDGGMNDPDLVLGTVSGGTSNLYVWYNRYQSASTPFNSIFPTGGGEVAVPDRSINLGNDICAITAANFNHNETSTSNDLVCGLGQNATSNIKWEPSVDGNPAKNRGDLTAFINFATATNVLNTDVTSAAAAIIVNDTTYDFVIGTNDNVNQGHLEVWRNKRTKNVTPQFVRDSSYYKADFAGFTDFGEIRTIVLADVVDSLGTGTGAGSKDGYLDIIVGTKTGGTWPGYSGQLVILRRAGKHKRFVVHSCVAITGAYINAIAVYNHNNYKDLAIGFRLPGATSTDYAGALSLLHNNANGTFTQTAKVAIAGEVTSVATGLIDIDNNPDVVCGVKTGLNTGQTLVFYQSPTDYLPTPGNDPSGGAFGGEVIAVRTVAFRPVPGKTDIVAGERFDQSGVSKGRIVIYFNKN